LLVAVSDSLGAVQLGSLDPRVVRTGLAPAPSGSHPSQAAESANLDLP